MDALGNDGNTSMPEQVKQPNPWRKMMNIYIYIYIYAFVGTNNKLLFLIYLHYIIAIILSVSVHNGQSSGAEICRNVNCDILI